MSWRKNTTPKRSLIDVTIGCLIMSVLIIYLIKICYNNIFHSVKRKDLTTLVDVLQNDLKISKGGKGGSYIEFKFKNHNSFRFDLRGYPFNNTKTTELINSVKYLDTLQFDILTEDYLHKIKGSKEKTILNRINSKQITIMGIRKGKQVFLNYEDTVKDQSKESKYAIVFLILSLPIFPLWFRYEYRIYKRSLTNGVSSESSDSTSYQQ